MLRRPVILAAALLFLLALGASALPAEARPALTTSVYYRSKGEAPWQRFELVHRGQKYFVYTTGGAIQRVALRTPAATYWVQNTILNELSNSTMIAIAESFRPLRR